MKRTVAEVECRINNNLQDPRAFISVVQPDLQALKSALAIQNQQCDQLARDASTQRQAIIRQLDDCGRESTKSHESVILLVKDGNKRLEDAIERRRHEFELWKLV
ncbi:MAG: hypothetical protein NXI04_19510 [Planctomycetaceae bacterium]|nr:hypothetical protein [Planctomycetaceae bacterium]